MDWLRNFLNQMWVRVLCVVMWVISTAVLLYDGVTVGELTDTAKLIVGLGASLALLIAGLRKLLQNGSVFLAAVIVENTIAVRNVQGRPTHCGYGLSRTINRILEGSDDMQKSNNLQQFVLVTF